MRFFTKLVDIFAGIGHIGSMTCNTFISFLKSKSCVFWDWNGTLIDDLDFSLGITNTYFSSKGKVELTKKEYLDCFTIPISEYYENLNLEKRGLCKVETSQAYLKNYKEGRHSLPLFKGAKDCLKLLKESEVSQVLFSAAHTSELEYQVERLGVKAYFDFLSGAGDFHAGCKLERGRELKERHSFSDGVLVGDTLHDVEIGKDIGFETVWVSEGHQPLEKAQGHAAVDYIYDRKNNDFYKNQ